MAQLQVFRRQQCAERKNDKDRTDGEESSEEVHDYEMFRRDENGERKQLHPKSEDGGGAVGQNYHSLWYGKGFSGIFYCAAGTD